jgi:hypothetical protein
MITIFTVPKPFSGHISIIQRNAIQSWKLLHPMCEIILLGEDEGTAGVAKTFGLRHISEIARNQFGTPLVSSIFKVAESAASYEILCYVNADIILMGDFMFAIQRFAKLRRKFLAVGQRHDLEIGHAIQFSELDWEQKLRNLVVTKGKLHPPYGIDYFIFRKSTFNDIPAFALGRTAWDNWLIYHARCLHIPVIDATGTITAIHQNHGYGHVKGGFQQIWKGAESKENLSLAGNIAIPFSTMDATHILTHKLLLPVITPKRLRRHLRTLDTFFPSAKPMLQFLRHLKHAISRLASSFQR